MHATIYRVKNFSLVLPFKVSNEGIAAVTHRQDTRRRAFGRRALLGPRTPVTAVATAFLCSALMLGPGEARPQALPGVSGRADTLRLTLRDARVLAVRDNPELRAARLDVDVARGRLRQASVLFTSNPSADVLAGGSGAEIGLSQEIEVAGQRGARRAAGRAGLERADAGVADAARLVFGEVDRAFYRLAAAEHRMQLADSVLALNQRLADVAGRQLREGEISRLEFNLAAVELGRSRSRSISARRETGETAHELRRLLGLAPDVPIAPLVPGDGGVVAVVLFSEAVTPDSLVALALSRRPDLRERAAAAAQARAEASVARREAYPNLALRASSEPAEGSGRTLRPGIGFSIPAFNRNRGEIQARRAEADQAELQRVAIAARVRADVASALASYRSAAAQTAALDSAVLAPARENLRLSEIAYHEGKIGLPVLLLIRNQLIDAELEYWEAWQAAHEALANLSEATGENLTDLPAFPVQPASAAVPRPRRSLPLNP